MDQVMLKLPIQKKFFKLKDYVSFVELIRQWKVAVRKLSCWHQDDCQNLIRFGLTFNHAF